MLLQSLAHFTVSRIHFRKATSGKEFGRSATTDAGFILVLSLYCMATVRRAKNQCCQALLVLWSGSALAKSTYLPSGGTNSCLDFSSVISLVTSGLCFPSVSLGVALNFATFSTTRIHLESFHGCQFAFGPQIEPPIVIFLSLIHIGKWRKVNSTVIELP